MTRHRDQQSTGSLGIKQKFFFFRSSWVNHFPKSVGQFSIGRIAAGGLSLLIHLKCIGIKRQGFIVQLSLNAAALRHLKDMAQDAESGDVRAGMHVEIQGDPHGGTVERGNAGQQRFQFGIRQFSGTAGIK